MSGFQPLRPLLYQRLQTRFGRVGVTNPGVAIGWTVVGGSRQCDPSKGHCWGETYRVDCPFCGDRRRRLYIAHMWGALDDVTRRRNLWLAYCQNEHCLEEAGMQRSLYRLVFGDFSQTLIDPVMKGLKQRQTTPGELPGLVWPLDRLAADHPSRRYLQSRHFDPDWLGRHLGVGCLLESERYWRLCGRIIIPVYVGGALVGWQARAVRAKDEPRYFTATGFAKGQFLYNFDSAKRFPYVVLVEGVAKVWRFGPEAVASFGDGVTPYQTALLAANWSTVFVLLDGNSQERAEKVTQQLRESGCNAIHIPLAVGQAPDDMPTSAARSLLASVFSDFSNSAGL